MEKLDELSWLVLRKVPDRDAFWTSDVAYDTRTKTAVVRPVLGRLEKAGLVERVVPGGKGHPTSWRRTDAGREALAKATP